MNWDLDMNKLFAEAKGKGMWLRSAFCDITFTPNELIVKQAMGEFRLSARCRKISKYRYKLFFLELADYACNLLSSHIATPIHRLLLSYCLTYTTTLPGHQCHQLVTDIETHA